MADGITLNLTAVAARFASTLGQFAQRIQTDGVRVVRDQMVTTRQVIVATTPVDTGALQAAWGPVQETSSGTLIAASIENAKDYAPVLEYGGYRGVGPRTVQLGGGDLGEGFTADAGIYSKQAPLGWVRKALADAWPQLQQRIQTMLRQAWPYSLGTSSAARGPESIPLIGDVQSIFGVDVVGGMAHGWLSAGTHQAVSHIMKELRSRRGRRV